MTRAIGELTIDPLSRLAAEGLADTLRERYKSYPYFRAAVFLSTAHHKDDEGNMTQAFVVRTNLINGLPPKKDTPITPPDARALKRTLKRVSQVAA